jgi:hypothetical protein
MLARGCRRLGVAIRTVFDWGVLFRIAVSAAIAAAAAWPLRLFLHRVPMVLASVAVYAAVYVLCHCLLAPRRTASSRIDAPAGRAPSAAAA